MADTNAPMRPLTSGPYHHFFGYFDKSPWLVDGSRELLAMHRTMIYDRMPKPGETVEIGFAEQNVQGGASSGFEKLGESRAWNLQQGAMTQWLPASGATLLYNDILDGEARTVAVEAATGKQRLYERPIACISPNGASALSFNFGRLTSLKPEYGYAGLRDPFHAERIPEQDGIWRLDLASGKSELLHSLAQIVATGPDGDTPGAVHYLNHALYNRTGSRFCFLHRYVNPAGTQHTRMLSSNADGSDLRVLISGMASHFGWRNADELLAWAGERAMMRSATSGVGKRIPIGKILRKLYRMLGKPAVFKAAVMKDRYIVFDHASHSTRSVAQGVLTTDGHCSFFYNGEWFVTDTYPDPRGRTKLLLCEWRTERVHTIQEFRMPPELDNEIRCDLHPRWHPTKPLICVDSVHSGSRQMYEIDVSGIVTARA